MLIGTSSLQPPLDLQAEGNTQVWKSLEDHYKLMKDPVIYPKMGAIMQKCVVKPPTMFHVLFEPDSSLAPTLNAPLVILSQITALKPDHTGEGFLELVRNLAGHAGAGGSIKSLGGCCGKAVEEDVFVTMFGWHSVEVRRCRAEANEA